VHSTKELDSTGIRTRTIERKLRQVQELPISDSKLLLDNDMMANNNKVEEV